MGEMGQRERSERWPFSVFAIKEGRRREEIFQREIFFLFFGTFIWKGFYSYQPFWEWGLEEKRTSETRLAETFT